MKLFERKILNGKSLVFSFVGMAATLGVLQEREKREAYDLSFKPPENFSLSVKYKEFEKWNYRPKYDTSGKTYVKLGISWKLKKSAKGKYKLYASFYSVEYKGSGYDKKKEFQYHILWTKKGGYLKKKGFRSVFEKEIKEGLSLVFNGKGEVEPGSC